MQKIHVVVGVDNHQGQFPLRWLSKGPTEDGTGAADEYFPEGRSKNVRQRTAGMDKRAFERVKRTLAGRGTDIEHVQ
jgi:hypothetical protein